MPNFRIERCAGLTDQEVIRLSLADMEYFACLVLKYEVRLIQYIKKISQSNQEEAEDILQDAFIKVWKNLNGFDPRLTLESWIFRIVHNETISFWRKKTSYSKNNVVQLDDERLNTFSVTDDLDELVQNKEHNNDLQVKALMENLKSGQGKMPKLVLPDSDGFQVIDVDDITYLEADRNYTKICLRDKTPLLSSYNLGWFEKAIENAGFFRISKSHIINMKYLQRFIKGEGGFVVMSDNTQLSISPGRKEELKKHFL